MKNPVTTAAGTFGDGSQFGDFIDVSRIGAIIAKGASLEPWKGNPPHRLVETPSGMLNSIGLQNDGVEGFIREKLPRLLKHRVPIIVGVFDKTPENYARIVKRLNREKGISGFEINLSCPNLEKGGKTFCDYPELVKEVVSAIRKATDLPIIAKLSPNVTDIVAIAKSARDAGADALSLINTLVGMRINIKTREPYLAKNTGGLSGPAIRPVALAKVFLVSEARLEIPIIGMGGIQTAEDAIEFLLAGASAVAIGTANFVNPRATLDVLEGIEQYMRENSVNDINDLIGAVRAHSQ
ncbi:MAG: Dihydroorotate dehydrogenase [Parcubacteria group bacterium GW2011_GWC2_44_17]|nr:MAG: Dihydroorotate dehydrogenase [Parcubacteria group bacterium GW2011_GWC2_44_17]KKT50144.1 MAG: Dihydroorotate dehydrogenase [Parcubacteria group bacterium GW2011_GWF2_44_17]